MVLYCIVCGSRKDRTVSYHQFPKNREARQKWLKFCGLEENDLTKVSAICTNHFEQSDWVESLGGNKLKRGSVPSKRVLKKRNSKKTSENNNDLPAPPNNSDTELDVAKENVDINAVSNQKTDDQAPAKTALGVPSVSGGNDPHCAPVGHSMKPFEISSWAQNLIGMKLTPGAALYFHNPRPNESEEPSDRDLAESDLINLIHTLPDTRIVSIDHESELIVVEPTFDMAAPSIEKKKLILATRTRLAKNHKLPTYDEYIAALHKKAQLLRNSHAAADVDKYRKKIRILQKRLMFLQKHNGFLKNENRCLRKMNRYYKKQVQKIRW